MHLFNILSLVVAAPGALSLPFVPTHSSSSSLTSIPEPGTNIMPRFVPIHASSLSAAPKDSDTDLSSRSPFVPIHQKAPATGNSESSIRPIIPRAPGSFKLDINHHLDVSKRSTATAEITFGSYWFAGSSAGDQSVNMLVDTGSADLWIISPQASAPQREPVSIYNPSLSRTSTPVLDNTFNISYGDGQNGVSGPVVQDTFTLGSASVQGMPIGTADSIHGIDPGTFASGILGLGFAGGNSIRPNPQPTFMEVLGGVLDAPVMVCNFLMEGGGSLEFGRVDTGLFEGDLQVLRADNRSEDKYPASWSSEGVTYVVDGEVQGSFDIVFDTGGPTTTAPLPIVLSYYSRIPGADDHNSTGSVWTVPCDSRMPDLELVFREGQRARIPGRGLLRADLGAGRCQTWFGREGSESRGLVGHAFFQQHVVVFDQGAATISWAEKRRG